MISEKEVEALTQIRESLVRFKAHLLGGMESDLRNKMFEVGDVDEYHTRLRSLQKLGHDIEFLMVPNESIKPPRTPMSDEELLLMLQKMQKEGKSFSHEDTEYHFVEALVLKEKLDAAIVYIDSCLPKPSRIIGFQQTPIS